MIPENLTSNSKEFSKDFDSTVKGLFLSNENIVDQDLTVSSLDFNSSHS
jgi:hypothetical protein